MSLDFFNECMAIVLTHEGGDKFTKHNADPGGATKYGISIRFAGSIGFDLDGDGKTTESDIRALTLDYAKQIYKKHFWDALSCSSLPPALGLLVFDQAVNMGTGTAAMDLQKCLGVMLDGVIGPNTIGTAHKKYNPILIDELAARRMHRYGKIKNFDVFGLGWSRRLMDIHRAAIEFYNRG